MPVSLSIVFNLVLCSPSCDHLDSDSEMDSFQKTYAATFWVINISIHGNDILNADATVVTSVTLRNWRIGSRASFCDAFQASKCIGVLSSTQYWSCLRSRVHGTWVLMFHNVGHGDSVMNLEFEYVNQRPWDAKLFDMARRNCPTFSLVPFKQYYCTKRRKLWQVMVSNHYYFFVRFVGVFPDVCQSCLISFCPAPSVLMWVKFWKRQFPEHLWCNVMDDSNFAPLWWTFIFSNEKHLGNWQINESGPDINLRSVSHLKMHRGHALRAVFNILAEPRAWPIGGDCSWRWSWKVSLVMILESPCGNQRPWDINWFNAAWRDGPTFKFVLLKQYGSTQLRKSWEVMAGTY